MKSGTATESQTEISNLKVGNVLKLGGVSSLYKYKGAKHVNILQFLPYKVLVL